MELSVDVPLRLLPIFTSSETHEHAYSRDLLQFDGALAIAHTSCHNAAVDLLDLRLSDRKNHVQGPGTFSFG